MSSDALSRALRSLDGLSVGDALGKARSTWPGRPTVVAAPIVVPAGPWPYTDDTVMAAAIVSTLAQFGEIDRDHLAGEFARRFALEPERGYGAGAFWLLSQLVQGRPWREVSVELFRGGSFGNGSAMRAAPLGAFFADDLDQVASQAVASAEVTHQHPDGKAGAVAIAIAAAVLSRGETSKLLATVVDRTPDGPTREGISRVARLLGDTPAAAAAKLGDGRLVRCSDTVPFALWCAAMHSASYVDAITAALAGTECPDADRDTMLAVVGGLVSLSAPMGSIPSEWLVAREPLPAL